MMLKPRLLVPRSREQQLVDILCGVAFKVRFRPKAFRMMDEEEFGAWLRKVLNGNGFIVEARGSSWAVLKEEN